MRFIIMHKTDARWEGGAVPDQRLIAGVGELLGELATTGALLGAEGLRPSSQGVRLRFERLERTISPGPFERRDELPAGFSIVRAASLDEAVEWATRQAGILGDVEVDIRPVTEPWDVGMAPQPPDVDTRRYMVLRKATAATEAGTSPSPEQRSGLSQLIGEATRSGMHLTTAILRPSRKGRRYLNTRDGITYFDGPFVETKELIGGYVIVSAGSLDEAGRLAARYIQVVDAGEADVRELE